jgi:hypothetical protein
MSDKELQNPAEGWDFEAEFPAELAGFTRKTDGRWEGVVYRIFRYELCDRTPCRKTSGIIYDSSTKEYMVMVQVGLTEFCDIKFIHEDFGTFAKVLKAFLELRLKVLRGGEPQLLEGGFRDSGISDWEFFNSQPEEISGFELFLKPSAALPVTNGSYLIADYSDFTCRSGLRILYNLFREDFYGELLLLGVPHATNQFDAKSLQELEGKLSKNLQAVLEKLRSQINAAH